MPADTHLPGEATSLGMLAPVAIITLGKRRHVRDANTAAEALFRSSRKTLLARPFSEIIYHDSPLFELLDAAQKTGRDITAHDVPVSGPGMRRKHLCNVHVRCLEDAEFILVLSEEAGRETGDSGAGISGFGRILGHEVKNPLAGIIGAAQLLERQAAPDQEELLGVIVSEARRIERLVTRLSAFELFSAPRLVAFNIHKLLDRVIAAEIAAMNGQVSYARQYDPSLPEIFADEDHLHEAIQNIMRNAAEASMAGSRRGDVTVRTSYAAGFSMRDTRAGAPLRRAIVVCIEDDGDGISPDRQATIFDMFNSSKSGGRGLGLPVVNEIVAAHGGHIRVDSRPGRTRFSVLLPINNGESDG